MMYVLNRPLSEIRSTQSGVTEDDVLVAIHEAAHTVAIMSLGYRVARVEINERGGGFCRIADAQRNLSPDTAALWAIAGYEGERKFTAFANTRSDFWSHRYSQDVEHLRDKYPSLTDQDIERERLRASHILSGWRDAVDAIASALLRHGELDEDGIRRAVKLTPNSDLLINHWKSFPQAQSAPARPATPPVPTPTSRLSRSEIIQALDKINNTPWHELPPRLRQLIDQLEGATRRTGAPSYRIGNSRIETRDLIPELRYSDAVGVSEGGMLI